MRDNAVSFHASTESMWLGAYRTTRQWEDEMCEQLDCDCTARSSSAACVGGVVGESDLCDLMVEGGESDGEESDEE